MPINKVLHLLRHAAKQNKTYITTKLTPRSLWFVKYLLKRGFVGGVQLRSSGNFKISIKYGTGRPCLSEVVFPTKYLHRFKYITKVDLCNQEKALHGRFMLLETTQGLLTAKEAVIRGLGGRVLFWLG